MLTPNVFGRLRDYLRNSVALFLTPPVLNTLALSGGLVTGTASTGTVIGATNGSVITSNVPGLTITGRAYSYDGSGSAQTVANGLIETLGTATKASAVAVTSSATIPAAPSIAVAAGNALNTITITDGSNGGSAITAHKLYRSTTSGAETLVGTIPIASGLTYQDNQLTNGTLYYYKLSAVNALGESGLSVEVAGRPNSSAGLTANQQLLAAMPARPLVPELGGSRERQNGIASGTQIRSMPSGQLTWAWMKNPRLFNTDWYYSTGVDVNSNGMGGMLFADDGNGAWDQFQRIPAILASDANVVVVAMSSNTVQANDYDIYHNDLGVPLSVANYVSLHQQICLALINGGKAVVFKELWERGVFLAPQSGAAISSITFSGTTATVTTATAHGLSASGFPDAVTITGATEAAYNVARVIPTITSATTFTYTMASTPSANATVVGTYTRNVQVGGVWASGTQPRSLIASINSTMKAWCQTQGIPFLEVRSTMTTTQVNGSNTDTVPVPDYVRSDSTHLSSKGGQVMGDLYGVLFGTIFTPAADVDETAAGNLISNTLMTGTTGTVGSGFTTGSVAPTGYSISRNGTTATVGAAIIQKNGRNWLEFTIDTSTMTGGVQESIVVSPTVANTVVGTAYETRFRHEVDAFDRWYGTPNIQAYAGSGQTWAMIPMDSGGSGISDTTSTTIENVPTTGSPSVAGKAAYAPYTGLLEAMPFKPATTTPTVNIISPSFRAGTGVTKFRIAAPEFRAVPDPALLMYNEASTTAPSLTSSASLSGPENSPFTSQVTTSKPVRLSLSGTDASYFTINKTGRFRWVSTTPPDYEDTTHAPSYSLNVVLTDFNPNVAPVTVPITVAITDVPDGTVYPFTGTDGTDIADLYTSVTRVGTTGAIKVSANTAVNGSSGGAIAETLYVFPSETGSATSQVDTEVRWTATSGASAGAKLCIRALDINNAIYVIFASGSAQLRKRVAGTDSLVATLVPYTTISANDKFIAQIINGVARIYQNGVLLATSASATDISVAGILDGTAGSTACTTSGLLSNIASGTSNKIDNFNPRPAMAIVSKDVLKTLALSNQQLAAGLAYAGILSNNNTANGTMSVTTDASGLFYVDGFNLRSSGPLGASGTVYTVGVTETDPNAVNTPKPTTFTITVP